MRLKDRRSRAHRVGQNAQRAEHRDAQFIGLVAGVPVVYKQGVSRQFGSRV
jgi:hypothetical protein